MEVRLDGRVTVVTCGTRGLGRAVVRSSHRAALRSSSPEEELGASNRDVYVGLLGLDEQAYESARAQGVI